jgi:hypothetical protein
MGKCCGSRSQILCLFDPWIRDLRWVKKSRSGSGIRDEHTGSYFRELKKLFWLKILKFLDADPDPGYGTFLTVDLGWKNSDSGSARLVFSLIFVDSENDLYKNGKNGDEGSGTCGSPKGQVTQF